MRMLGLATLSYQRLVCQHERCTRSQHRINQNQGLTLKIAIRDILHLNLKGAIFRALAISRDKGTMRIIKVIQKTLMQRQSCTQNCSHNNLVANHLHRSLAKWCLHNLSLIVERARNLITHNLAHTLEIAAKTHRIALHLAVANLSNEFVENRILLVQNVNHSDII